MILLLEQQTDANVYNTMYYTMITIIVYVFAY